MDEELFTIDEVAAQLKVTRRRVRDWLWRGELRGIKLAREWRVPVSAIEEFLHPPPAPDPLAPVNEAVAKEGLCTEASKMDQLEIETGGREFAPRPPQD